MQLQFITVKGYQIKSETKKKKKRKAQRIECGRDLAQLLVILSQMSFTDSTYFSL